MDSSPRAVGRSLLSRFLAVPDAVLTVSLTCLALLTVLRFIVFFPLAQGEFGYAAWVEDDFFYYAVIAQNLADTGQSTFDGVSLSNGYHPLWMVVCTVLAALFDIHSASFFIAIFIVQALLVFAGVVAFAALGRKAMEAGVLGNSGLMVGATVYGVALTIWGANGMEIALLAPLAPMLMLAGWRLCEKPDLRRAFITTALLCATLLSRLDMVIVFLPLGLGVATLLIRRHGLGATLKLAPALTAFIPLALYLVANIAMFGGAMPISGQAKRLTIEGAPFGLSAVSIETFMSTPNLNYFISPVGVTLLTLIGAATVLAVKPLRASRAGIGFLLLVAGVALFYLQSALTSDWKLWPWYFFPMMLTGGIAAAVLTDLIVRRLPVATGVWARWIAPAMCALFLAFALKANAWLINSPPSVSNALFTRMLPLRDFAMANPGRYAMGDGAGVAGFLIPGSVVQLEGLVNDRTYLAELEHRGSIYASLKRQKVDYYITSLDGAEKLSCVELREPMQGGPRVPRMKETACEKPVFTSRTDWVASQIWDVRDGLN